MIFEATPQVSAAIARHINQAARSTAFAYTTRTTIKPLLYFEGEKKPRVLPHITTFFC